MFKKIIFYLSRILSIALILFLSLFALDVFTEYSGFSIIIPLLIHLLPSIAIIFVTVIAFEYALLGAILFILFGLAYLFLVGVSNCAIITIPMVFIGILFIINWLLRKK
ncbi:MAG: hypothetical protein PHG24_02450, partial [Candidatus Pacebacteria bacterium]|nr:hypothetical protein [Candidatus Paceibacterota bacterium]